MPTVGYVTMVAELQGRIEGGGSHGDAEGLIEIVRFDHLIELPRKGSGGAPAGVPVHRDLEMVKRVDISTPKLYQAFIQRERLTEVRFEWFRQTGNGEQELYYSIVAKNALVTEMRPWMPDSLDPRQDRYGFMEKICLAYETIVWSWGAAGDVQFETTWKDEAK